MDNFDDITYGQCMATRTDSLGVLNGSVRPYGVWTAKNTMTGNVIKTNAYHSFDFNGKGQIHIAQDYFDASGVMAAAMVRKKQSSLLINNSKNPFIYRGFCFRLNNLQKLILKLNLMTTLFF